MDGNESPYFTDHPALTPDGETLIFAYNGDLWTVPTAGGTAGRLTALDGRESHPRVSPDGKWLAFTSGQYRQGDVYVMPLAGGPIRQLTFHDANDRVAGWNWTSDEILFVSNRYNRGTTYAVPPTGGTPRRLFEHYFNTIHNPAYDAKTGELYFNESWESDNFVNRKGYKGPFNPDIKKFSRDGKSVDVLTAYDGKDLWPLTTRDGRLFFVSDRDGAYNLYASQDRKSKQLTRSKTGIYAPVISADGSKVAYVEDYQLRVYDVRSGKVSKPDIRLNAFAGLNRTQDFKTKGNLSYFDVARDGKKLAFVSRGELFVSDLEGKFIRLIPTGPGRVLECKWLKDDRTLVFNQTLNGYPNLFTVPADGSADPTRRTNDRRSNRNLEMSHDTSHLAYLSGRDELRLLNLDDFSSATVAKAEFWGFQNNQPRWSPDDRYLLFAAHVDFENDLYVVDLEEGNKLTNLTRTGVAESNPVWGPEGKYIYFESARHQPSYPRGGGNTDLYRVPLRKWDAPYRAAGFEELFAAEDKDKKKDSMAVVIDVENFMERLERVGPGFGYQGGAYVVKKGDKTHVLYGSQHEGGGFYQTIYEDFERPETKKFDVQGVSNATDLVEVKGKYYLLGAGTVMSLDLDQSKGKKIDLEHTFRRNLADEFNQMYYETWAGVEENFYNEDFHGADWPALRDRYAKFLPYLTDRADLRRLTNDLLGELNTSHYGFYSNGDEEEVRQGARTQVPGIKWKQGEDPYVVAGLLTEGPLDRVDNPVRPGDRLVAVNGNRVNPTENRERYFSAPSRDREMTLTFERGGKEIDVRLHPVSPGTERRLRYDEWMDANQARVDELGDKRVAYVHMKNMGGGELDRFLNEMVSEGYQRDALILDLRYNTGGNVHDAVLQHLSQRPYLQWQYREGRRANQPNFAPAAKPIILLINQQSLSDAEMTAAGFQELGLGTIIGTPTYRWIIFTSGKGLVDGSFYRLPSWGTYTLDGKNLEKTGVEPDVRVDNTAADRVNGRDPQLERAVKAALDGLRGR